MKERKYILFDFDGTLSDPGEGMVSSFILALRHFGIEGDPVLLRTLIGPR
jgi:phosphoglycolate phosphatase